MSEQEQIAEQEENDRMWRDHEAKQKSYNRNVTYILLPAAAGITLAGVFLMRRKDDVLGEGLALGGIATSVYAIITASIAGQEGLRLAAVTLFLASALLLAHKRFMEPSAAKPKKKKKR